MRVLLLNYHLLSYSLIPIDVLFIVVWAFVSEPIIIVLLVVPFAPILNILPPEFIVEAFKVEMVSVPCAVGYVKKIFFAVSSVK